MNCWKTLYKLISQLVHSLLEASHSYKGYFVWLAWWASFGAQNKAVIRWLQVGVLMDWSKWRCSLSVHYRQGGQGSEVVFNWGWILNWKKAIVTKKMSPIIKLLITVEPSIKYTPNKGQNRNNFRTKDKFQCTKWRLSYSSLNLRPLNRRKNGQKTMGLGISNLHSGWVSRLLNFQSYILTLHSQLFCRL